MKSENSQPDLLDLDEAITVTAEDRDALWKARIESRKMTTEEYLAFLQSFPAPEPNREIRGFNGLELEL